MKLGDYQLRARETNVSLALADKLQRAHHVVLNFDTGKCTVEVVSVNARRGYACFRDFDGDMIRYELSELVEKGTITFKGCLLEVDEADPEETERKIRRERREKDNQTRLALILQCRYRSRRSLRISDNLRNARVSEFYNPLLHLDISKCFIPYRSKGYGPPNFSEQGAALAILRQATKLIELASSVLNKDLATFPIKDCLSSEDYDTARRLDQDTAIFQMSLEDPDTRTLSLADITSLCKSNAALLRPLVIRQNAVFSAFSEGAGDFDTPNASLAELKRRQVTPAAVQPLCALFEFAAPVNGPTMPFLARLTEILPSLFGQIRVLCNPSFTNEPINSIISGMLFGKIPASAQMSLNQIK